MKDPEQLQKLNEAWTGFLVQCELIDGKLMISDKNPVMIKTAKNVFLPEIIWSESESELKELTAAIHILSKGLDLVLADQIIKN